MAHINGARSEVYQEITDAITGGCESMASWLEGIGYGLGFGV